MAVPRNTHLAIAADLREKIRDGKVTGRTTVMQLAEEHHVSRGVVLRAVHLLQGEGLIAILHGDGVYAAGEVDRTPLMDRVTNLLRTEEVTVGDTFPSENELCERFGVSRSKLRTVLAVLEGRGLIGRRGGRGRIVLALPTD